MEVIFVKQYIDLESYSTPVVMDVGDKGYLIDEVTGLVRIEQENAPSIDLGFVPSSVYAPVLE